MTVEHKDIGNTNLHEPLGALAASVGQTYVSDGAGSGTWKKITISELDANSIKGLNRLVMVMDVEDVTLETDYYLVVPLNCDILEVWLASDKVNAGPYTVAMSIGGVGVTNGTITVAGSGSAGDVDSIVPSGNNTIAAGAAIKFTVAGAPAGNSRAHITVFLDVA